MGEHEVAQAAAHETLYMLILWEVVLHMLRQLHRLGEAHGQRTMVVSCKAVVCHQPPINQHTVGIVVVSEHGFNLFPAVPTQIFVEVKESNPRIFVAVVLIAVGVAGNLFIRLVV